MGTDELAAWVRIFELAGPFAPVLMGGLLLYSFSKREKTPSESGQPMTRADYEKLEARVHDIEAAVNRLIGAQKVK